MLPTTHRDRWIAPLVAAIVSLAGPSPGDEPMAAPKPLGQVEGFPDWVTAVAFSPDGATLAAGTYDEIRLIDPATREAKGTLKTRNGYVRDLAFSSDGARLLVGDYQSLTLWDAKASRRISKFAGHTGYVTGVAFAGETVVSCSEDGTVRLWKPDTGEVLRTIAVGVPVQDLAVSPGGELLATASGDPTRPNREGPVALWDLRTGEKVAGLVGHERAALAVRFSDDGTRLASAGQDEKVNLHDATTRKAIGYYAEHSRSVNGVAFLAGGNVMASVSGGNAGGLCELRLWRPDGSELAALEPHEQRIPSLAASPDGRTLALGSQDKTVTLWDVGPVLDDAMRTAEPRPPVEAARP